MSDYEIIVIVLMIMGLSEGITTRIKITAKAAIQCGYLNKPQYNIVREHKNPTSKLEILDTN